MIALGGFASREGALPDDMLQHSYCTFESGKGKYWTSELMLEETLRVCILLESIFPHCRFLFYFDNSSNHRAKSADVLDVKKLNLHPGGHQRRFPPSVWNGAPFQFQDENDVPKGIQQILKERNCWVPGMKCEDARVINLLSVVSFSSDSTFDT